MSAIWRGFESVWSPEVERTSKVPNNGGDYARSCMDCSTKQSPYTATDCVGSVEADATELFLQLTTEPEYTGLRINESYGLTILHQDGSEIPVRSAGAEHVVALSLVGALQRNAPLQGPIFIDSPFGGSTPSTLGTSSLRFPI